MAVRRRKHAMPQSKTTAPTKRDAMNRTADPAVRNRRCSSRLIIILAMVAILAFAAVAVAGKSFLSRSSMLQQGPASTTSDTQSAPTIAPTQYPHNNPQSESESLQPSPNPRVSRIGSFELLETVPHDPAAFTQGLFVYNQTLYEGTGNYGESYLRTVDMTTGAVLKQVALEKALFGEGIAHYPTKEGMRIVQLTYKEQTGIVWDMELNRLHTFQYETTTTEGWGVTYAEKLGMLLVSDGSESITMWDPALLTKSRITANESRRLEVMLLYKDATTPQKLSRVNEMEWDTHSNTLLANVWLQDVLVRIDMESGFVTHIYDLQALWPDRPRTVDVLNGIAITDEPEVVWVTGKWWPSIYKIRLID
jgi:glutamine cyclotransferase